MIEVLGLAGIFLFFAGAHVLWQSREEVLYWLQKFLDTFQKSLRSTAGLGGSTPSAEASPAEAPRPQAQPIHAMRMMSAFGLLVLGPLLVLISLFLSM